MSELEILLFIVLLEATGIDILEGRENNEP